MIDMKKQIFEMTLELNRDYEIECRVCGKKNKLMKAHYGGWRYRSKLEGIDRFNKFICKECNNEI